LDARVQNPAESSIGDLFHQLVNDGRNLVGAEVNLYKQIALYRVGKAKTGLIALVAAGLLAYAGLIALLVGSRHGSCDLIGPVAGGLVVFAVVGHHSLPFGSLWRRQDVGIIGRSGREGGLASRGEPGMSSKAPKPELELERARYEAEQAKKQFASTLGGLQYRLKPATLANHAWEEVRGKSSIMADDAKHAVSGIADEAMTVVKERPGIASGVAAALFVFLAVSRSGVSSASRSGIRKTPAIL
jgi:hypothetical protein